jgi:hypothetical protein
MPVDKNRLVPGAIIEFDICVGLVHSTYIDDLASKTVKCKVIFGSSTKTVFVKQADIVRVVHNSAMNSYVVPGDEWTQDRIVTAVLVMSRGLHCEVRQLNQGVIGQVGRLTAHMEDYPNKNAMIANACSSQSVPTANGQWTFNKPVTFPSSPVVPFPETDLPKIKVLGQFQIVKNKEIDCTCDSKALVSYGCQCEYSRRKK